MSSGRLFDDERSGARRHPYRWRHRSDRARASFIKSTFPGGYVLHQASVLTALASVLVIVDLCVPGSWLAHVSSAALVASAASRMLAYLWHFPIFFPARRTVNER